MQLSDLNRMGIPERLIDIWRRRQGEALLPVQRKAVRKGLLDDRIGGESSARRVLLHAPTSSGKSFCAELAAVKALTERRKAVMLFPLKSLAEEKYRLFKDTYTPLGIKVIIATGDHPENDTTFLRGNYHLAVAIYEKFDLLLTCSLDALQRIGLVVIDELQMIGEPGRGAVLERLLTKMLASSYAPDILALSAALDEQDASRLAVWLKAELIEETSRPVDLLRGVAIPGMLKCRSYNSGLDREEAFGETPDIEAADFAFEDDRKLAVFLDKVKTGENPTLVFLKSRQDTVNLAFKLAASVNWPPAKTALTQLDDEEPSFLIRSLKQVLSRGVAFHNADLSQKQREVIEQAFRNKGIKALFSTTTLAMGVNLPAATVYLETVKYNAGIYDDRPVLVPISRVEFDNMTGRAGRLGWSRGKAGNEPGRAIVLADSEFDRDILWNKYIANERQETLTSVFSSLSPSDWLLSFAVSGLVTDRPALGDILSKTFKASTEELEPALFENALQELHRQQFITLTGDAFQPTALGEAVARTGLAVRTAHHLLQKLDGGCPETPFGWIALVVSAPETELPSGILTRFEQLNNTPLKWLYQYFDHCLSELSWLFPETDRSQALNCHQLASLKALMLLEEWRQGLEIQRLEEKYQVHLGQIIHLGESAAHLILSVRALLESQNQHHPHEKQLNGLAFSLRRGLPSDLQEIHYHLSTILNRGDFMKLYRAEIKSLRDLTLSTPQQLENTDISSSKLLQINDKLEQIKEEVDMSLAITDHPMGTIAPDVIEIDGSFDRERYLVRINGFPVRLTGKSFKYLTKLAWSRLKESTGWIYKEDIEIGFNQARYLYRMKNEISAGLNFSWPVVENNRLGYYRLNIDPSRIKINLDNLKNHPDYELRTLVGTGSSETVN